MLMIFNDHTSKHNALNYEIDFVDLRTYTLNNGDSYSWEQSTGDLFVKKTTSIEPPDPCNSKQFMDEQTFYLSSIQIDKDIQIFHYKSVQEFERFGMKWRIF